jgi:hypothetical protein
MSEKIVWVAVDFDHPPTEDEMQSIADSLDGAMDHEAIVTTREVKPMDKEQVRELLSDSEEDE